MAPFRHIFVVLALSILSFCQVFGADSRDEWIAALTRLARLEGTYRIPPWLNEMESDVVDGDESEDMMGEEMPSTFFSYSSSAADRDASSYEASPPSEGTAELRMPNVHPTKANDYFCHAEPMPTDEGVYIVGFDPLTTEGTAHHILIYGCKEPGSDKRTWDCGEMDIGNEASGNDVGPPCETEAKILYAWAMDAPSLQLPPDVGFEVGMDTGIDYLVLQVHYKSADKFKDGSTDDSGVALTWTMTPQPLKAGVYFMGTDGEIPGESEDVRLEAACEYDGEQPIHPFAYRVHTHKLGQVVSGYRIHDGLWTEIGKRSPQLPQMFNPITEDITVMPGDTLAMRCTFSSARKETTYIGMSGDDEMCNFYIMYYVEGGELPSDDSCYKFDPYKWSEHLTNIPDKEASTLPDQQASTLPREDEAHSM